MITEEILLPASNVRSLAWSGDSLVDWVGGGAAYALDGSSSRAFVAYSYPFDAVATLGDFVVIYCRLGTKGLVLKNGKIVREIDRSFYHADIYEYPVCLLSCGGRALLVHCPVEYCKLEIEDAETGEKLTSRTSSPADFFHSRLAGSPAGTRLLSAGWIWHPVDAVALFDVAAALRNPDHLNNSDDDSPKSEDAGLGEEHSACWQSETNIIITGPKASQIPWTGVDSEADPVAPPAMEVIDTTTGAILASCVLDEPAGTIMPIGNTHVIAFYKHPRLIRLSDGVVEKAWVEIASGEQLSSILGRDAILPSTALDPRNGRFAIAQEDGIHVVSLRHQ